MKIPPLFLIIFFSFTFAACSSDNTQTTQKLTDGQISIAVFKSKLASVKNPQLVDVRTPQEFNGGTLEGAVNIDFRSPTFDHQLKTLNKNAPVFIFCQSGGRSGKGYTKMKKMGFSTVYDMEGGYGAWSNQ